MLRGKLVPWNSSFTLLCPVVNDAAAQMKFAAARPERGRRRRRRRTAWSSAVGRVWYAASPHVDASSVACAWRSLGQSAGPSHARDATTASPHTLSGAVCWTGMLVCLRRSLRGSSVVVFDAPFFVTYFSTCFSLLVFPVYVVFRLVVARAKLSFRELIRYIYRCQ